VLLTFCSIASCQTKQETGKGSRSPTDTLQVVKKDTLKDESAVNLDSIGKRRQIMESFKFKHTKEYEYFKDSVWLDEVLTIETNAPFNDKQFFTFVNVGKPLGSETPQSFFYIYHYQENSWKLMSSNVWKDRFEKPNYIYTRDLDFDRKSELIVKYPVFSASRAISRFEIFKYDSIEFKMKHFNTLFSMDSIYLNDKTKTFMTTTDGGNYGVHSKTIYQWMENKFLEVKELERSFVEQTGKLPYYELREYKYKSGVKRLVKKSLSSLENEDDFYEKWGLD
jgi:hypothetical protein